MQAVQSGLTAADTVAIRTGTGNRQAAEVQDTETGGTDAEYVNWSAGVVALEPK